MFLLFHLFMFALFFFFMLYFLFFFFFFLNDTATPEIYPLSLHDAFPICICGVSLGGYLAPRCAAFEPRLKAVASCGGLHSLGDRNFVNEHHLRRFCHIWGAKDEADVRQKARGATLDGAAKNIRAPLLIVHGEKDNLIPPSDPYRTYEQASGPKRWVCYPEGNHVCNNIIYKYRPLVADFMVEHLA